jgi:serine/threonine-protein kinase
MRSREPELPPAIGRYEVRSLLGEGSMGRVLLAHDPVLDRDVAIKHLRDDLEIPRAVRDGLITRMRHEARAAARVAHPNLVVLHDMGEDDEVGLYLVFELVVGPTLKQRLVDGGHLAPAEAGKLARELGAALHTAHEAGILHRDVKPENVMLAKTGGKIADFGIARIPDSTLTHQGGLMGTPAYSAPETFRGGKHSPLSDQFSLAATLYEAISGQRAFPGDDAVSVAARIASEPPAPFAASLGLPIAVDAVLARALSRRPEERFSDCDAFGDALARSLVIPVAARIDATTTAPSVTLPPPERRTGQVLIGAVLVVGTVALVGRTALRAAETTPPPEATAAPAEDPSAAPAATHGASVHTPSVVRRPRARPEPTTSASSAPAASPDAPDAHDAGAHAATSATSATLAATPTAAPSTSAGPLR